MHNLHETPVDDEKHHPDLPEFFLIARSEHRFDLVFEDDMVASVPRYPSVTSDSVRFNAAGYRFLAARLYQRLQDEGAL